VGVDGLLGEGGQDPHSEGREPREDEKGRESTSVVHNGADAPVWGSSGNEGRRARSTHVASPGAYKESTHQRGKGRKIKDGVEKSMFPFFLRERSR
jgi:hypothetical protein